MWRIKSLHTTLQMPPITCFWTFGDLYLWLRTSLCSFDLAWKILGMWLRYSCSQITFNTLRRNLGYYWPNQLLLGLTRIVMLSRASVTLKSLSSHYASLSTRILSCSTATIAECHAVQNEQLNGCRSYHSTFTLNYSICLGCLTRIFKCLVILWWSGTGMVLFRGSE